MSDQRKTAMITGANSGVGFELTKKLLNEGWDVIALIRSGLPNDVTLNKALKSRKIRVYKADLSNFNSLKIAYQK